MFVGAKYSLSSYFGDDLGWPAGLLTGHHHLRTEIIFQKYFVLTRGFNVGGFSLRKVIGMLKDERVSFAFSLNEIMLVELCI